MKTIREVLTNNVKTVAIAGHVNPDGDCVGSCMALALYLKANYPEIETTVYLENIRPELTFIKDTEKVKQETGPDVPDLFVILDVSALDRIGVAGALLEKAPKTVCIDHHMSNSGLADINHIRPEVGSCAEVLYELLDEEKIDKDTAEALYTGMIHDTGVFQYTNTRPETLSIAGKLIARGFDFSKLIYASFYSRTFLQEKILGYCLSKSRLTDDGAFVYTSLSAKEMADFGVTKSELGEIVSQLKLTKGVEAAVFAYALNDEQVKFSLRSSGRIDVNKAAGTFGGGGHIKAAGCTLNGDIDDAMTEVLKVLATQNREVS